MSILYSCKTDEEVATTSHAPLSDQEVADRLAIRELFDAYAHCADRRDAEGQKALFTVDTRFAVYLAGQGSAPKLILDWTETRPSAP